MIFISETFVKTVVIILLITNSLCTAKTQSVTTKYTAKKIVATSYKTLHKITKVKCVKRCNKNDLKAVVLWQETTKRRKRVT